MSHRGLHTVGVGALALLLSAPFRNYTQVSGHPLPHGRGSGEGVLLHQSRDRQGAVCGLDSGLLFRSRAPSMEGVR